MKVLLLNPPSFAPVRYVKEGICQGRATPNVWPPATLATLHAILGATRRIAPRLVDGNALGLSQAGLARLYADFRPDVLVLNTTTPSFWADLGSAALARRVSPPTLTLMIGPHASATAEKVVATPHVDIVVRNEPERIVENLFEALLSGRPLREVRGITYREGGTVRSNEDEPFVEDLDELPWPDRSSLDLSLYSNPLTGKRFTVVRNSRGCPYPCAFCVKFYYGTRWRTRSAANVVAELSECVERYGITDFLFNADLFTFEKEAVVDLCRAIVESRLAITWVCNSRVDCIDEERLAWMKRAGCRLISFGIESASQRILDGVRKGIRPETARAAIELVHRHGIRSVGYFVLGLPGETRRSAEETVRFSMSLPLDYASFLTAVPYPGTELRRQIEEKGRILDGDWTRYDEAGCDVVEQTDFAPGELTNFVRSAHLRWYGRPSRLARGIAESLTWTGMRRNISLVGGFIGKNRSVASSRTAVGVDLADGASPHGDST